MSTTTTVDTIWKFPFDIADRQTVDIPGLRKVLRVGADPFGRLALWAVVAPDREPHGYTLSVVGTGHPFPEDVAPGDHVGSFVDGPFVWHVFLAS